MSSLLLAIDQGTTSTRAIVFDAAGQAVASAQRELAQHYPRPGWVEHDPEEIWASTLEVCRQALAGIGPSAIAAIGITNQRETALIWERANGRPIHNAIVWQDRRTADLCTRLKDAGYEAMVTAKTGLLLDPYFSASKIAWLHDHVPGARARAERGELAFGTDDNFLLWRLTGGKTHATDATNAARTALFDIQRQDWDEELLRVFGVPRALLPEVRDCASAFGATAPALLGQSIAIAGVAGDQQAALIGQACFTPGMIKSTYGTGCFAILNTGANAVSSHHRLLTTVAYRLHSQVTYALEGSIFVAGAAVQWLRDGLGIIKSATETERLAESLASNQGVYLVPAFTGLGAPHWDANARGALFGLSRASGPAELARAALESVCYQTHDLLTAMAQDGTAAPAALRVDGGMAANGWLLQNLADITGIPVERPRIIETTALGAAYLAGLQIGVFDSFDSIARHWQCAERRTPRLAATERAHLIRGWARAVRCARAFGADSAG
ncbi:MAG: glycerol kinase GlpK [Gammaproteobacteria bacterium]